MVAEQLEVRGRAIRDERVLQALVRVPRHEFVPADLSKHAYADRPLPIGCAQTISQPYIVALMSELLAVGRHDTVLEIGTGSGYKAAVLSELVAEVHTIEIVDELAARAAMNLRRLGCRNVFRHVGDGYQGWPEQAPYDAVIVTCAPDQIPEMLVTQLKEGGRMVLPVGPEGGVQELFQLEKGRGTFQKRSVIAVRFVPMTRKRC